MKLWQVHGWNLKEEQLPVLVKSLLATCWEKTCNGNQENPGFVMTTFRRSHWIMLKMIHLMELWRARERQQWKLWSFTPSFKWLAAKGMGHNLRNLCLVILPHFLGTMGPLAQLLGYPRNTEEHLLAILFLLWHIEVPSQTTPLWHRLNSCRAGLWTALVTLPEQERRHLHGQPTVMGRSTPLSFTSPIGCATSLGGSFLLSPFFYYPHLHIGINPVISRELMMI